MKKVVFFLLVVLSIVLSSCLDNSDWGKVIIPASQKLVFSPSDNPLDSYEKHIFVKTDDGEMFIVNRNLTWKICYFKAAFPEKDIVIDYVKIEEDGKVMLDPRFINIKQ